MAQPDQSTSLTEQYLQLTRETPRKMCDVVDKALSQGAKEAVEAEHSLRRIEGRVGSIT